MANNLVTVHEECHQKFHQGKIKHVFKKPKQYKETAFMNILRKQIINRLNCEITYGSYTMGTSFGNTLKDSVVGE
ncbi:hypothetical protein V7024_23755 [Bacillus sp. JJ864]|uniref:hypothetical protein n=1 Tax=Bacillus sp. JJ864 TaxID=3122975 RepID=UPI002FFE698F